MDAVPISADAYERERNATVAPQFAVAADKPLTLGSFVLSAVAIAAVTFAAYSSSLTGTALFRHVPNSVEDPVLDNTMLHSRLLFPKISTGEFMLATRTEYRPLGYALQALVNLQLPQGIVVSWHAALILLHAAAAFLVFLTMRRLVVNVAARAFAAAYAAHPLFVPLVNDVNEMYFLWGLLFTTGSILLYMLYLKSAKVAVLVASGVMFAAAARTCGDHYRRAAGVSGEIDFRPVHEAFRFDKEGMRRSFTGDPTEVMRLLADREAYVVEFKGNKYEFSEAALEIGRYFVRRGDFAKAQGFLQQAVDANPRYADALREAIANSKQLNRADDAARFERMLEAAGR